MATYAGGNIMRMVSDFLQYSHNFVFSLANRVSHFRFQTPIISDYVNF